MRATVYVSGALLAIAAVFVAAAPASLHFGLKGTGGSTSNATSGRGKLISGGLELFADRPLEGYGSGSFETEYRRHQHANGENATSASHTIPITVAAEQGIVGLAVYVALILAALLRPLQRCRPLPSADCTGCDLRGTRPAHVDVCRLPRGPDDLDDPRDRRRACARGPHGDPRAGRARAVICCDGRGPRPLSESAAWVASERCSAI